MVARATFQPPPLEKISFRAADVLLFSGHDRVSQLIKLGSVPPWYWPCFRAEPHWRWISHVAICFDYHSETLLVESTTLNDVPCAIRKVKVAGVQAHDPRERIAAYNGHVWRMRPARGWDLSNTKRDELTKFLYWQFDQPYDALGAIRSATWFPGEYSRQVRFCSDLNAASLSRVGLLAVSNPKKFTPSGLVGLLHRNGNFPAPLRIK